MTNYERKRELYDKLVKEAGLERKGKTMPYTSSNGYMFSQLNKDAQIGIRLPKEEVKEFISKHEGSGEFKSYGAVMRDYVLVPDELLENDFKKVVQCLKVGYDYVNTLKPK